MGNILGMNGKILNTVPILGKSNFQMILKDFLGYALKGDHQAANNFIMELTNEDHQIALSYIASKITKAALYLENADVSNKSFKVSIEQSTGHSIIESKCQYVTNLCMGLPTYLSIFLNTIMALTNDDMAISLPARIVEEVKQIEEDKKKAIARIDGVIKDIAERTGSTEEKIGNLMSQYGMDVEKIIEEIEKDKDV